MTAPCARCGVGHSTPIWSCPGPEFAVRAPMPDEWVLEQSKDCTQLIRRGVAGGIVVEIHSRFIPKPRLFVLGAESARRLRTLLNQWYPDGDDGTPTATATTAEYKLEWLQTAPTEVGDYLFYGNLKGEADPDGLALYGNLKGEADGLAYHIAKIRLSRNGVPIMHMGHLVGIYRGFHDEPDVAGCYDLLPPPGRWARLPGHAASCAWLRQPNPSGRRWLPPLPLHKHCDCGFLGKVFVE